MHALRGFKRRSGTWTFAVCSFPEKGKGVWRRDPAAEAGVIGNGNVEGSDKLHSTHYPEETFKLHDILQELAASSY